MSNGWTGHSEEIDWDSAGNNALPEGVYRLNGVGAKAKLTSGGKPSVDAQFEVAGTYEGEPIKGRKVFDTLTITREAAFKVKNLCSATGGELCPPRSGSFQDVEEFAHNVLDVTREGIFAFLKQDTYEGKVRNKVKEYLTAEEAEKRAMKFAAAAQ